MTWLIIIGLVVVGGLASAVWPTISAQLNIGNAAEIAAAREPAQPIVIDIEKYLLGPEILNLVSSAPDFVQNFVDSINGREISQAMAIGIISALTIGSLVILGGPLAFIYTKLESSASAVQEDEEYKAAVSALDKRQTAVIKEQQQAKPAHIDGNEASDRRGFAYTMAFLGIIFAWVIGTVIGHMISSGEAGNNTQITNPVGNATLAVVVIALVGYFLYFRFIRKPEEIDPAESDYSTVPWGWVWVIISGLLIVGVGAGLALNMISSGA